MSNAQTTSTPNTTTSNPAAETPAWQQFCADLRLLLAELGADTAITVEDRANYVKFESTVNKHKFYVPKNKGDVSWIHTTLLLPREAGRIVDLPKGPGSIGKIESFVAPDLRLLEDSVIPGMVASGHVLRANRKPARRKTGEQPVVTAAPTPMGSEEDLTAGMSADEIDAFLKA